MRKRYFVEYDSDNSKLIGNVHHGGTFDTLEEAIAGIVRLRKNKAAENPRNMKVYDTDTGFESAKIVYCAGR